MKIAELVINIPINQTFYYYIPEDLLDLKKLCRVKINFNNRDTIGYVLNIHNYEDIENNIKNLKLKPIISIIDDDPIIDNRIIEIAKWMSYFYVSSLGEVLFSITPSARTQKKYKHNYKFTGKLSILNQEQIKAINEIEIAIQENKNVLLHGVTGSGKTEVYKHLVKKYLNMNKSVILLVPEISLTPQNLERFYETFGEEVSIYHSKLTNSERLGEWLKALKGKSHLVIGPRSAIFSPVQNLGLIIIDEEHETSYKSNNTPRYHARQVAHFRANLEKCNIILGSATPLIETFFQTQLKKPIYKLVELKNRYGNIPLPKVSIIDMKSDNEKGNIISSELLKKMMEVVDKKKQVLLFLNRRGFSPILFCKDCGFIFTCSHCDVTLTYHKKELKLKCHHCGYNINVPLNCPSCNNVNLSELGAGTEKIEYILKQEFINFNIARMDLDTTINRTSYIDILNNLKNGNIDILIGTQMITKGHDIPGIQLVGVILPDITLNIPDFRSSERTFILLTQVIGRAGRKDNTGEAIIQTYLPDNKSIIFAAEQNYYKFYFYEIKKRQIFNYPPFKRIGRIVIRGEKKEKVEKVCKIIKEYLNEINNNTDCEILGPVSCPLEKLKKYYRYHIIIKSNNIKTIIDMIKRIKDYFDNKIKINDIYLEIDIDPLSMI